MIELKLLSDFPHEIIAVDEVGRSPLSGPVVIGALRLQIPNKESLATLLRSLRRNGVKDSKLLKTQTRLAILDKLKIAQLDFREKGRFVWKGIGIDFITWEMDHEIIDAENIFQASMRGMKEAALFLAGEDKTQITVLIDGQSKLRWSDEGCGWREITIVKGDVKSPLIGLAAIIAKEKRDAWMRGMHEQYPHYGFDTNFGYPTPFHRKALAVHGPCPIHRKRY